MSSSDPREPGHGRALRVTLLAGGTCLSYALAWVVAVPALLPVLNTLPAVPVLYLLLRRGRVRAAVGEMLVWAGAMAVCATTLSYWQTVDAGNLFINGEAYRQEMFAWVRTGAGAESDPAQFLPQHAGQAALFIVLSIGTGSALSMPLGAVLMNYMSFYVGALARESARPLATVILAWHPWSVVRIVSFITFGVVLAGPVLARVGRFSYPLRAWRGLLVLALGGLAVDVALKWLFAPAWQVLLKQIVGW